MYSTVEQETSFLDKHPVRDMARTSTDGHKCVSGQLWTTCYCLDTVALRGHSTVKWLRNAICWSLDRELQSNKPCPRAGLNLHNGNGYAECNSHAVPQSQQLN